LGVTAVRRMAASILKVGESRVWIDPERMEDVEGAITRDEVRRLVHEGAIRRRPEDAQSKGRLRARRAQERRGRRRGHGTRKGASGARTRHEREWVARVRAQRRLLKRLREEGSVTRSTYRALYMKVKGGAFPGVRALRSYAEASGLLRRAAG